MSTRSRFAYAQARLQARLGEATTPEDLQHALAAGDLASALSAVRATSQRRYAARLAPDLDAHELERHLRHEWFALVDEVARWQPREWAASLGWLRWLPSLPLLQKLAGGGRPPAWARDDPWLGRIVATEPALRGAALARTPLHALRPAFERDAPDIVAAWLAHWRELWPRDAAANGALERIVRDVAACDAAVRDPATGSSREPLRLLRRRLLRSFRRHPSSPAAAVAFLALEGLGLLALRGGVMRHAVLDDPVAA